MAKKKVNPRRIPLARKYVDKDAILEEDVKGKVADAWVLVANALYEEGYTDIDEIDQEVSHYLDSDAYVKAGREELRRAGALMSTQPSASHMKVENIRSAVELEAYKKKAQSVALYTALNSICLGLMQTGKFSEEELRRVFFNVDLSLAEIERGRSTLKKIEKELAGRMVKDKMAR